MGGYYDAAGFVREVRQHELDTMYREACPDCATLRAKLAEAERQRDEAVKLLRECIPALGYKGPFAARIKAYLAGVQDE